MAQDISNREKYKIPDSYSGPLRVEKPKSGNPPYEFYSDMDSTITVYDDGTCTESRYSIHVYNHLIVRNWPSNEGDV